MANLAVRELQNDPYCVLFPMDLAHRASMRLRAGNITVPEATHSGAWRQFLIVFPAADKDVLKAAEWVEILNRSRETYPKARKDFPVALETLRARHESWQEAVRILAGIFSDAGENVAFETLESLLTIVALVVRYGCDLDYVHCAAFVVGHLYLHIFGESMVRLDDSPKAVLFDKEFVLHDVYLCAKRVLELMTPVMRMGVEEIEAGISYAKKTMGRSEPFVLSDRSSVMSVYRDLFQRYVPDRRWVAFLTFLFSRDCSPRLLHYLYANTLKSEPGAKEAIPYVKNYMSQVEGATQCLEADENVYKISGLFDDLIEMMQGEPDGKVDMNRRRVLLYQISQIIRVLRSSGIPDELVPSLQILSNITE